MWSIHDFIARDSLHYAARYIARILERVDLLGRFPELGHVAFVMEGQGIREVIFDSYRIFYRVESRRMMILGIVHAARDLDSLDPKPWETS